MIIVASIELVWERGLLLYRVLASAGLKKSDHFDFSRMVKNLTAKVQTLTRFSMNLAEFWAESKGVSRYFFLLGD